LDVQEAWGLAHPGVYALVGSGAMLGGFTQMSGISESQVHGNRLLEDSGERCGL